jgi:hypothetical protein
MEWFLIRKAILIGLSSCCIGENYFSKMHIMLILAAIFKKIRENILIRSFLIGLASKSLISSGNILCFDRLKPTGDRKLQKCRHGDQRISCAAALAQ